MGEFSKQIKGMQPAFESCQGCNSVKALSELANQLQIELNLAKEMYPKEMQMVENTLETVEELQL